jgi:hypothetical protein
MLRTGFAAMAVMVLAAGVAFAASPPRGAKVLVDVPYAVKESYSLSAPFAQDGTWSWVGTPGGLFRLEAPVTPGDEASLVGFEGNEMTAVYVHDGALYVLKRAAESMNAPATDRSFLRSTDGGATFVPLDDGLEECLGSYCAYLTASQAAFEDDVIYLVASGNLLASKNEGPWVPLVGEIATQACYDPTFAVHGRRVLIGGECPLDMAYVRAGMLRDGMLEWELEPRDVITPALENRNVQFIRFLGDGSVAIAGIEGAILRSSDGGASFDFVLHHPLDDPAIYPYVTDLLVPASGEWLLAGGFDKANLVPYLAWSSDEGRSWQDVSHVLGPAADGFDVLAFLHEEPSGRILAGLVDLDGKVVRIVELVTTQMRVRPVRRAVR